MTVIDLELLKYEPIKPPCRLHAHEADLRLLRRFPSAPRGNAGRPLG
jgi:hypothetical protein